MAWLQEFRARVGKIEDKGTFAVVNLSESEKNQETEKWDIYNDFSFVKFFGKAYGFAKTLKEGDIIVVKQCKITKQSYTDKGGKKQYPKHDAWAVFSAEMYTPKGKSEHKPELPPEDDIPF